MSPHEVTKKKTKKKQQQQQQKQKHDQSIKLTSLLDLINNVWHKCRNVRAKVVKEKYNIHPVSRVAIFGLQISSFNIVVAYLKFCPWQSTKKIKDQEKLNNITSTQETEALSASYKNQKFS